MFTILFALIASAVHLTRSFRRINNDLREADKGGTFGRQMRGNFKAIAWMLPLVLFGAALDWVFDTGLF